MSSSRAREQKRRIELQPAKVAITCYNFFSTTHAIRFIVPHTHALFLWLLCMAHIEFRSAFFG